MLNRIIFLLFIIQLLISCSEKDRISGNTSETQNTISGVIEYEDKEPAVDLTIYLYTDEDSLSSFVDSTSTDTIGTYRFTYLAQRSYRIFGLGADGDTLFHITSIIPNDSNVQQDITLHKKAYGSLLVSLPDGLPDSKLYLSIGDSIVIEDVTQSELKVDSIPEGNYMVMLYFIGHRDYLQVINEKVQLSRAPILITGDSMITLNLQISKFNLYQSLLVDDFDNDTILHHANENLFWRTSEEVKEWHNQFLDWNNSQGMFLGVEYANDNADFLALYLENREQGVKTLMDVSNLLSMNATIHVSELVDFYFCIHSDLYEERMCSIKQTIPADQVVDLDLGNDQWDIIPNKDTGFSEIEFRKSVTSLIFEFHKNENSLYLDAELDDVNLIIY